MVYLLTDFQVLIAQVELLATVVPVLGATVF